MQKIKLDSFNIFTTSKDFLDFNLSRKNFPEEVKTIAVIIVLELFCEKINQNIFVSFRFAQRN